MVEASIFRQLKQAPALRTPPAEARARRESDGAYADVRAKPKSTSCYHIGQHFGIFFLSENLKFSFFLGFLLAARESVEFRNVGIHSVSTYCPLCLGLKSIVQDALRILQRRSNTRRIRINGFQISCFAPNHRLLYLLNIYQRRDRRINCGVRLKMSEPMQPPSLSPKQLHSSRAAWDDYSEPPSHTRAMVPDDYATRACNFSFEWRRLFELAGLVWTLNDSGHPQRE